MTTTPWKAWRMWRGCGRKRAFKHQGQVRREADRLGINWYKCNLCEGYHLTKKAKQ